MINISNYNQNITLPVNILVLVVDWLQWISISSHANRNTSKLIRPWSLVRHLIKPPWFELNTMLFSVADECHLNNFMVSSIPNDNQNTTVAVWVVG